MLIVLIRQPNLPPNFEPGTVRAYGPPEDRCYRDSDQSTNSRTCPVSSYATDFSQYSESSVSVCRVELRKKGRLHYEDPKEDQMETHRRGYGIQCGRR